MLRLFFALRDLDLDDRYKLNYLITYKRKSTSLVQNRNENNFNNIVFIVNKL